MPPTTTMPRYNGDNPIRRAAGVIAWKVRRGMEFNTAVAEAHFREPELSDSQIAQAAQWAAAALQCAKQFNDMFAQVDNEDAKKNGLAKTGKTLRQLMDECGVPME